MYGSSDILDGELIRFQQLFIQNQQLHGDFFNFLERLGVFYGNLIARID